MLRSFSSNRRSARRPHLRLLSFAAALTLISTGLVSPSVAHEGSHEGQAVQPADGSVKAVAQANQSALAAPISSEVIGTFAIQNEVKAALIARGVPMVIDDPVADVATLVGKQYFSSHGWVTFKGEGLAFGRPNDGSPFELGKPQVLLYRPIGQYSDEQLSDMKPDAPYELVGVAYFTDYLGGATMNETPTETPPSVAPIPDGLQPTGAWFRHSAGCHMNSGTFVAFLENLPEGSKSFVERFAQGVLMCSQIGRESDWVQTTPGDIYPGAPGRCELTREMNPSFGELRRPVEDGANVPNVSAPVLHPPRIPLRAEPRRYRASVTPVFGDSIPTWVQYGLDLAEWLGREIDWGLWNIAKGIDDLWLGSVRLSADLRCENIGTQLLPGNGPTFWHGAAWDSHLFFRKDGTTTTGVVDMELFPTGYVGPDIAFLPSPSGAGGFKVLDFGPVPAQPASVAVSSTDGDFVVSWTPPAIRVIGTGIDLPITGYEIRDTVTGSIVRVLANQRSVSIPAPPNTATFSVAAINANGVGAARTAASATVDNQKPQVSAVALSSPTAYGWYKSSASFRVTATDNTGIQSITWWSSSDSTPKVVAGATADIGVGGFGALSVSYFATDTSANQSSTRTINVFADMMAPRITSTFPGGGPYPDVWYNRDVPFRWNVGENSGLTPETEPPTNPTISGEGTGLTSEWTFTDRAGNSTTASVGPVKIDRTPPIVSIGDVPSGWVREATVSFSASDALSGVRDVFAQKDGSTLSEPTNIFTPTATFNTEDTFSITLFAVDNANNPADKKVAYVRIDRTPPTVSGAVAGGLAPNAAGWMNRPFVYEWAASDAKSGVDPASVPAPVRFSSDGTGLDATVTVTDLAGNSKTQTSPSFKLDSTNPNTSTIGIVPATNVGPFTIRLQATDGGAGVDSTYIAIDGASPVSLNQVTVSSAGAHTIEYWSTDVAGNIEARKSVQLTIVSSAASSTTTTSGVKTTSSTTTSSTTTIPVSVSTTIPVSASTTVASGGSGSGDEVLVPGPTQSTSTLEPTKPVTNLPPTTRPRTLALAPKPVLLASHNAKTGVLRLTMRENGVLRPLSHTVILIKVGNRVRRFTTSKKGEVQFGKIKGTHTVTVASTVTAPASAVGLKVTFTVK